MKIGTSAGGAKAKAIIALKFKDGKPYSEYIPNCLHFPVKIP